MHGRNAVNEAANLAAQYPALRLIPLLALGLMLVEWLYTRLALHDVDSHDLRESASSFAMAVGNQLLRPVAAVLTAVPLQFAYAHRLLEIPTTGIAALIALFVLLDFFYYWYHYAAHHVRIMWATHAVHHSATRFNLTAAIRLGWTGPISGAVFFFMPLALIGFHPFAVIGMFGLNLLYQFVLHTAHAPRLGPLEWVLNTPTHHRVHHASNESCLDRNFGGVLIVWDRLFGTFAQAPKHEVLRFGLAGDHLPSQNPFVVAFHEWRRMCKDAGAARGLRAKIATLFGTP
jgi:sterol desaturase/sphingolipid hydroxylase (fatty acid hydroxylase superfamily)